MSELLARNEFLTLLGLMVPCVLVAVVAVVAINTHHQHLVRRAELDAELKRDMLQRGMTAADIAHVILTNSAQKSATAAPTAEDRRHELVREMIAQEMSGEDIARVVAALAVRPDRAPA